MRSIGCCQTVNREDDATYKLPLIVFSLEMSKFQVTLRSLSSVVGIEAWQSPKTVIAANSDQTIAEVETACPENEHLLKQSASKQKLSVCRNILYLRFTLYIASKT